MKKFLNFVFDHTTKKVAGAISIILALAVLCLGLLTETGRHVVSFLGFVGFIIGVIYGGYRLYKYTTENARKQPKVYDDDEFDDEEDDGEFDGEDDDGEFDDESADDEVPAVPETPVRRPRSAKRGATSPAAGQPPKQPGEQTPAKQPAEQKPAKQPAAGQPVEQTPVKQPAAEPKTKQGKKGNGQATRRPRPKPEPAEEQPAE